MYIHIKFQYLFVHELTSIIIIIMINSHLYIADTWHLTMTGANTYVVLSYDTAAHNIIL